MEVSRALTKFSAYAEFNMTLIEGGACLTTLSLRTPMDPLLTLTDHIYVLTPYCVLPHQMIDIPTTYSHFEDNLYNTHGALM
jgi:hypothetical protein